MDFFLNFFKNETHKNWIEYLTNHFFSLLENKILTQHEQIMSKQYITYDVRVRQR